MSLNFKIAGGVVGIILAILAAILITNNNPQIEPHLGSNLITGVGITYNITTCAELQDMSNDLAGNYVLAQDIDCVGFDYGDGYGFMPVGNYTDHFTGTFDGQGHTISNIYINRLLTQDRVGLFGETGNSAIHDVGLVDVNISGSSDVGALVGESWENDTVYNVYVTGNVTGADSYIGGIIGSTICITGPTILNNSYAIVNIGGLELRLLLAGS
jgi:hypothetical protein